MIILNIITIIVICILVLILLLLFIPFGYSMRLTRKKNYRFYGVKVHWLFGLIQVAFNNKYFFHLRLFGKIIKINKITKENKDGIKKKKKSGKKRKEKKTTRKGILYLLKCAVKVLKKYKPEKLVIKGKLGFEDPSITALTQGITNYFHALFNIKELEFIYDEEVYNGTVYLYGRITLYYLVFTYLKLMLYKPTRQLFK